jgi:Family of unknown function (DUF5372)
LGFLVVTHRFHPLFGQRLPVVFVKKRAGRVVYVCEGGLGGSATVTFAEGWTDRGLAPVGCRLSVEGLIVLDTLVAAIVDLRDRGVDHLV